MSVYMTRVELHDAKYEDYQLLHANMTKLGFSTIIAGDNGLRYHLPPAEYVYASNYDYEPAYVRDLAKQAASMTGRSHAVVTSRTNGIAWFNLPSA